MNRLVIASCLGICVAVIGCVQNAVLINLNADGSGTLHFRLLQTLETSKALKGRSSTSFLSDRALEQYKAASSQFGEGVEFVEAKVDSGKPGWSGIVVTYRFADVNTLTLPEFASDLLEIKDEEILDDASSTANDANAAKDWNVSDRVYRFERTTGETHSLTVIPYSPTPNLAEPDQADPFADAGLEVPAKSPSSSTFLDSFALSMLKPYAKDVRFSILLNVEGQIANLQGIKGSGPTDHSVFLFDANVGQMAKSQHFDAMVTEQWTVEEMLAKQVEGLNAVPTETAVVVTYRPHEKSK